MKRIRARFPLAIIGMILISILNIGAASVYTVTYQGNGNTGGSVPVDKNKYLAGQSVRVLGNTGNLVRTGYTFDGWNKATNAGGDNFPVGSTFKITNSNVILYAKWIAAGAQIKATVSAKSGATSGSEKEKEALKKAMTQQANSMKLKIGGISSTLKRAAMAQGRSRLTLIREAKAALKTLFDDSARLNDTGTKLGKINHLPADMRVAADSWKIVVEASPILETGIMALLIKPCKDTSPGDCASDSYLAACIDCCNQRYPNDATLLEQSKAECQETNDYCRLLKELRQMQQEREEAANRQREEDEQRATQAAGG
jgi:uncharacterized repeat protein (TIGR02543 family)